MVSNYKSEGELLYTLVQRIRPLYNELESAIAQRLEGSGLTVATRHVLEKVAEEGSQAVPSIAESLGVERQHVQRSVNTLIGEGLVKRTNNPEHRRSYLVHATPKGKRLFRSVRKREEEMLLDLAARVKRDHVARADDVLAEMTKFFIDLNSLE